MKGIESLFGRREFLIAGGAATTLALAPAAKAAEHAAASGCGANQSATIKGLTVEKPVHTPSPWPPTEMMGGGAPGGGMPGGGAGGPGGGAPGEAGAAGGGAPGGTGGASGPSGAAPGGAGGPGARSLADSGIPDGGMPGAIAKATPAIYVENGNHAEDKSSPSAVSEGKVTDRYSKGAKIKAKLAEVGGVFTTGIGTEYVLADATIDLDGDASMGLGGPNTGASAEDYATLVIRNCTITTTGKWRAATAAQHHGVLKVYNSTLKTSGAPFKPDFASSGQKTQLEIDGNCRTHITLSNSTSHFYYSTIIAEGWAALSTDTSDGYVYLEANDCTVKTLTSGYGTYADGGCHCVLNRCTLDVADMAGIMAGESDISFNEPKAKCGSYFALIHNVGSASEVGTLKVCGGEIETKKAAILVKSANAEILVDGAKIKSGAGVLLKSAVSVDPNAAAAAKPKGKVYGIHATLRNMDAVGDILHDDKENRGMTVYLEATTLKGAIKDASIKMNRLSKWTATADSNVTIVGDIEVSQIDAPAGVTITAVAGQSGTYKLAGCGTLILKAS
jgi:hypothetical protein